MATLNMGSMNFALFPVASRYKEWKHDWERDYVQGTRDTVIRNAFGDIEKIVETLGARFGTRFEFECYDVSHLYTSAHFLDRKIIKPPLFVRTIFGILGGIDADPEDLVHMRSIANRLFGDEFYWSVLAAGRHQLGFVTLSAIMGGHVRVGLEDSLYIGKVSSRKATPSRFAGSDRTSNSSL
jgi:uncharacterized protein (DUF849 family)